MSTLDRLALLIAVIPGMAALFTLAAYAASFGAVLSRIMGVL